jgi:hypothetical protein
LCGLREPSSVVCVTTLELPPSQRGADCPVAERPGRLSSELQRRPSASGAVGIAALFAAGRPCDGGRVAHRPSLEFDARASATTWILDSGLRRLNSLERHRIVVRWRAQVSKTRMPLICDEGCDVRIVAGSALRDALLEWLPLSRVDLAVYEGGLFEADPASALALLLRPPTIWSLEDAVVVDGMFPRTERFDAAQFDAILQLARRCVQNEHRARVRRAAAKIEGRPPVVGLPRASAIVAAGCAVIATDDERCTELGALQLARFASSALVGREEEPPNGR